LIREGFRRIVTIKERKEALAALEATAGEHGFALSELVDGAKTKSKSPPKYRHPENAELTWSGRGRKPKWFSELPEAGRTPEDLEI
jgi:DNA-binding protein H-NS